MGWFDDHHHIVTYEHPSFQSITAKLDKIKELLMATLEEASALAAQVDAEAVAYINQLKAELAAAQAGDPNAQAQVDAISTATASLQAVLPPAAPTA